MTPEEIKCREAEIKKREESLRASELNFRWRSECLRDRAHGAIKGIITVTIVHSLLIGMLLAKIIFQ